MNGVRSLLVLNKEEPYHALYKPIKCQGHMAEIDFSRVCQCAKSVKVHDLWSIFHFSQQNGTLFLWDKWNKIYAGLTYKPLPVSFGRGWVGIHCFTRRQLANEDRVDFFTLVCLWRSVNKNIMFLMFLSCLLRITACAGLWRLETVHRCPTPSFRQRQRVCGTGLTLWTLCTSVYGLTHPKTSVCRKPAWMSCHLHRTSYLDPILRRRLSSV